MDVSSPTHVQDFPFAVKVVIDSWIRALQFCYQYIDFVPMEI